MASPNDAQNPQFLPLGNNNNNNNYNKASVCNSSQLSGLNMNNVVLNEYLKSMVPDEKFPLHHQNLYSSSLVYGNLTKSSEIINDDWEDHKLLINELDDHDHDDHRDNKLWLDYNRHQMQLLNQDNMMTRRISFQDLLLRKEVEDMETRNQITIEPPPQPIMTGAMAIDPAVSQQEQEADWLQFQLASVHNQEQLTTMMADSSYRVSEYEQKSVLDVAYSENRFAINPMPNSAIPTVTTKIMKKTASSSDSMASMPQLKRRRLDDTMEKSEKKRNRMMKNRESAARSRAKKQAYVNHLQQEIFRLKKINENLKKEKKMEELWSQIQGLEPCDKTCKKIVELWRQSIIPNEPKHFDENCKKMEEISSQSTNISKAPKHQLLRRNSAHF